MADPAGKESQFTVNINGSPAAISSLSLKTGDTYTIIATLVSPISLSDAVTITYTAGDIRSVQGGYLATFDPQTVTLQAQIITFTTNLTRKFNESPFTVSASASSGLSMTYSSSNQTVCTIAGTTATLLSAGTSDITARQAGNATWAPANYTRILTVSKGDQTITFNPLSVKTFGDPDFALTATASSGLSVTFASNNSSVATVAGNMVHIVGAGTATITASQPGNSLWNPASDVPQTLTVNKADQTITFGVLPVKTYGDADFTLTASSSSGLSVSYTSDNTAVATVTGNVVHITGAGSAVITASQPGNANYNPASDVPQTLTVNKADQTITFGTLPGKVYGDADFAPGASSSSGLTISYASGNSAVATIAGNMIHITGAGSALITASQAGDANHNPAADVQQTLTVGKGNQTITFTDYPEKILVTETGTLAATSSGGVTVLFESLNNSIASVSDSQVTGVANGTVQIRAYNNGDANYNSAEAFVTINVSSAHKDIMNLFTPNNDGFNDLWELPQMEEWGRCEVRVFSRSGKLVFADDDYDNTWDGTMDGNPVPEGPYYYVIKTENAGTVKGTLNIVR
jgi:gliding motility-associated-like protein